MVADVVGYSRLMGRDESGTLLRLKKRRGDCLEPSLARNGGRIVKLTGDGGRAGFASAVGALREAEAPTGGILISRAIHDAVAGKLKLTLQDQGELVLKNIERPVQAFRVEW